MNGSSFFLIEAKGSYIVKNLKDNSSIQRIRTLFHCQVKFPKICSSQSIVGVDKSDLFYFNVCFTWNRGSPGSIEDTDPSSIIQLMN